MLGDISNQFWSSPRVTASMVTMLLKYRFGQLWNIMKIAYRQQRPYFPGPGPPQSDRCPHCGRPDSGGHILGGCMKPSSKAMYIHRHDLAMRLTLKAISKGNHGGYHTIADIGRAELIEDMGVNAKRIPTWLLPNSCLLVTGMEPADRHKIRPDIMLTEMTRQELMRYYLPQKTQTIQSYRLTLKTGLSWTGLQHVLRGLRPVLAA